MNAEDVANEADFKVFMDEQLAKVAEASWMAGYVDCALDAGICITPHGIESAYARHHK